MKYTIELTDTEYNVLTGFIDMISTEIEAEYFQKAKLEPTEKAWEDKLEKTKLFAYRDGFEHGKLWTTEEYTKNRQGYYDEGYNKGIEDLAHAMIVYFPLNSKQRFDYFGTNVTTEMYARKNPKDLIAKAKAYEEKKKAEDESIKVGDEVLYGSSKLLVTKITNASICTVNAGGKVDTWRATAELIKTGRHFDEVEQLLDKLRGETDEKN